MKFDVYLTKDGRWFCPTGIYPHLLHAWCQFLQCSPESGSIRDAINKWDPTELDEAAARKNLVFALCLSPDECLKHPQGQQLAKAPLVEIVKERDAIHADGEEHQLLKRDTIIANSPYGELVRLAPPVTTMKCIAAVARAVKASGSRRSLTSPWRASGTPSKCQQGPGHSAVPFRDGRPFS